MADWGGFCPACGKNNAAEETLEQAEEILLPETEEEREYEPSAKVKKMKRNMAMVGCFALLAVLATVLFFGIRGGTVISDWFDRLKPKANDIYCKETFTVEDKKAEKKGDVVVATMGDEKLTNTELQFYYWTGVYDFLSTNYYYLSYMGLDYTKPLDEQTCAYDKTMTWQQYFLKSALDSWHGNMAFVVLARENNFQMPEEYRKTLDSMAAELETTAKNNGYDSVDQLVQESFGAGCTLEDYLAYMENHYLGNLYFAELYDAVAPTVEELDAYFKANREALEKEGIKQDGSFTVDVRHILVHIDKVEGVTEDTPSEERWNACLAAAQKIYDEYLEGELTEENFGKLANKYSHDKNGQVTDGGIYADVQKGQMVAEFDAWCFDETRKPGDTDLVKTQFGYHVMYFVGSEETWITGTRSAYMNEKSNEIVTDALDRFELDVNYKKIVLGFVTL